VQVAVAADLEHWAKGAAGVLLVVVEVEEALFQVHLHRRHLC